MHTEQVYKQQANGINIAVLEYIRLDIIMTIIYCYLERGKRKVQCFEISYE